MVSGGDETYTQGHREHSEDGVTRRAVVCCEVGCGSRKGVAAVMVGVVSRESVMKEVRLVLALQGSLQFGFVDRRRRKGLAGRRHSMNRRGDPKEQDGREDQ